MVRPVATFVALMLSCVACGSASEVQPKVEPGEENSTVRNLKADATTTSLAPTTTLAPTATDAVTMVLPTEPTIYRPEPIWEGDQVTAMIQPVEGVELDSSSVKMRIVESSDGRFLEVDLTNAVVPAGAAFWTTEVNGRLKLKTTARQGSTQGSRLDRAVYGDSFIVCFSATTAEDQVLATTGDIRISE
jgi:hypothetical protein